MVDNMVEEFRSSCDRFVQKGENYPPESNQLYELCFLCVEHEDLLAKVDLCPLTKYCALG